MSSGLSITRDFVSQDQIDEARQKRAEEWKKAYESGKTDAEAPPEEEEYDPRTLYEKIAANKQKKEDEFAESTRLSNLIHRIDEDESEFLSTLQTVEQETRRDKLEKEKLELSEFRRAVAEATLHAPIVEPVPLTTEPTVPIPVARRKRSNIEKTILESGVIIKKPSKRKNENNTAEDDGSGMKKKQSKQEKVLPERKEKETERSKGPLQSLVSYGGDSDAEESNDEES